MNIIDLLDQIVTTATLKQGISSAELYEKAGLYASGISRIRATGDCRFSTISKLLEASGLTLLVVDNQEDVIKLAKGELF